MVEQWIQAASALQLVNDRRAICARLHAGLLNARAHLFKSGSEEHKWALLPRGFWWAEGQAALEQNWERGDFSTWIEHKHHLQAFGVEIGLAGLLEMIPFDRRATLARSLSVAGDPGWISAKEAFSFACSELRLNANNAGRAIIEQAKLGFVTARAVLAQATQGKRSDPDCEWQEREWDIPTWFWENFTSREASAQDWTIGMFSGRGHSPIGARAITLSGVHFLLESLTPTKAPTAHGNRETPQGRKPKYDWPGATSKVWGLLNRGDLKPTQQVDIELALIRSLGGEDHEPSQSTVRPYAKIIWEEFQKE